MGPYESPDQQTGNPLSDSAQHENALTDIRPGKPLYSPVFDLFVPLVFAAAAVWLAGHALKTLIQFAHADAPILSLTLQGLLAPSSTASPIPWTAVAGAKVFRGRFSAALLVDLGPGSDVRMRIWPFSPAGTISLWVSDPDTARAAIQAHLSYCDLQLAAT